MDQRIVVRPEGAPPFPLRVPEGSDPAIVRALAQSLAEAGAHVGPGELAIVDAELSGPPVSRRLPLMREIAQFRANSRNYGYTLLHYMYLTTKDSSLPGCVALGKVCTADLYAQAGWAPYIADAEHELLLTPFVRSGRGRKHDQIRLAPGVREAMDELMKMIAEQQRK